MTAGMFLLAFIGGALAIASPCVLPVLPLVFSRAGRPVWSETIPLLMGLALAFTSAATTATVAANWLLVASEFGRSLALVLMAIVGLSLLSGRLAEAIARPFTRAGASLLSRNSGEPRRRSSVEQLPDTKRPGRLHGRPGLFFVAEAANAPPCAYLAAFIFGVLPKSARYFP